MSGMDMVTEVAHECIADEENGVHWTVVLNCPGCGPVAWLLES